LFEKAAKYQGGFFISRRLDYAGTASGARLLSSRRTLSLILGLVADSINLVS
jgi:hypothetical protein